MTSERSGPDAAEVDRISRMLSRRNVFITGGTGFMGKVLMEKLLRCVPDIGVLYLLVRPKKGIQSTDRLQQIFQNPLFNQVKEKFGIQALLKRCIVIPGDCTLPQLGISPEHKTIIVENVSIIYHCAATIRFDEALKTAVLLNTRGTKLMLELARECTQLELFCHVSTSYCHLNEKMLLEKPYAPPTDPHKIIKAIEWMDDDTANAMTKVVLGNIPNTYAYTKCLSEALVVEQINKGLPAVIFRPSIVIPIRNDPIPGWTDNVNGPTGLLIGAGKGVIRTMYCNSSGYGDFLPVDFAVNALLIGSWNYISNKDTQRFIYNLTSSADIKVSWEQVVDIGRWVVCNRLPLNGVMWYPGGSMKSSRLHHNICSIFYHWLPAIIIDCLLYCIGYPPVLCRVHRRIQKGFDVFEYYANNQWDFDNTNILHLRSIINELETKRYAIEDKDINLNNYFEDCIRAARLYILNESDESIPAARRHMRILYFVDKFCKLLLLFAFFYMIVGILNWCFV